MTTQQRIRAMTQPIKLCSLADAIRRINDGDVVALGGHASNRQPMAAVREIVRQRKRNLHLVGWDNGIEMDLLIGAGCVTTVETANVAMGSLGLAHNYRRAAEAGQLRIIEHSETTAMARFRAASMGLPMLPVKMGVGADLSKSNPHLKPFSDPFRGEPWLAVEAILPDVAIVHAHSADAAGNVQLDAERWRGDSPDRMIARSARIVIVTVEQIVSDEAIKSGPTGTIKTRADATCVVEAPYGAHPCCCDAGYDCDLAHLETYYAATATAEGFQTWLTEFVTGLSDHSAYLDKIGSKSLMGVSVKRTALA